MLCARTSPNWKKIKQKPTGKKNREKLFTSLQSVYVIVFPLILTVSRTVCVCLYTLCTTSDFQPMTHDKILGHNENYSNFCVTFILASKKILVFLFYLNLHLDIFKLLDIFEIWNYANCKCLLKNQFRPKIVINTWIDSWICL